jgi:hypothetical protein
VSNLDPLMNYDDAAWQQQNAAKMTPDALTPPYQAQGFASQEQYNNAYGYQPSSIYGTPSYGAFDNNTSAINQTLAGTNTPSGVDYTTFSNMTAGQQTATGAGEALAAEFGLQSLNSKIVEWVLHNGISDANVLFQNIYASPEFKAEFPEIAQRQAKGLTPLSPQQILDSRQAYAQALQSVGISPSFLSKDQMTKMIVGDVSPAEVQDRLTQTVTRIQNDPSLAPQLQRLYGLGVTPGEAAAYFLDPDHTESYLTKQITAASLASRSEQTGFAQLNQSQAENLAGLGITDAQAREGFNTLGLEKGLFNQGIDENGNISKDVGLAAQFQGNADAQRQLERRKQERQAAFGGGGNFADPNRQGLTGAGTSNS